MAKITDCMLMKLSTVCCLCRDTDKIVQVKAGNTMAWAVTQLKLSLVRAGWEPMIVGDNLAGYCCPSCSADLFTPEFTEEDDDAVDQTDDAEALDAISDLPIA